MVESGLRAALAACEGVGARSVAVPALGTGVGRFDLAACAGVFAAVLAEVGGQPGRLPEEVMIVLRTADAHAVFVDALGALGS